MFDNVLFVAPPVTPVREADVQAIEVAFGGITLPPDYRQFLLEHGFGWLDGCIAILSPEQVIGETLQSRRHFKDMYLLYAADPEADLPLALDEIDQLVYIGYDYNSADEFFFMPGTPPRFIERPDGEYPSQQGTTFAEWITSLDSRERFGQEACRTIREGMLVESDGLPGDIPWLFPFVPDGYDIPHLQATGDLDLGRMLQVFEDLAHQDHRILFCMSPERDDVLDVRLPMFNTLLRHGPRGSVAVYVPADRRQETLSWLAAQFLERGHALEIKHLDEA